LSAPIGNAPQGSLWKGIDRLVEQGHPAFWRSGVLALWRSSTPMA
jgi:hypothetical protein